jgi:GLPGLI family protein
MRYIFSLSLVFFSFFNFSAQNSSFEYNLNFKTSADSLKIENIVFYLDVKNKESVFRSDKFRYSDSIRIKRGYGEGFDMQYNNRQLYIYKNIEQEKISKFVFVPLLYSVYTINIDDKLLWNILDDKQVIGNYKCQKAVVDYGGRKWIAWFTNEIPLQEGPYVFHGLPGLIVKISDEKNDYVFQLQQVLNFNWKSLYEVKSQKEINWENFKKLQKDFYNNPLGMTSKSDIISYDESGNIIKTDFKKIRDETQKRIVSKNNPIELNHKVDYNKVIK